MIKNYFFIAIVVVNAALAIFIYNLYSEALSDYHSLIKANDHTVSKQLHELHAYTINELKKQHEAIAASDHELDRIQAILNPSAYEANGLIRFIWANELNHLVASSHTQHLLYNLNLASREYIKRARAEPNTLYISEILEHIDPNIERKIITYSMGVSAENQSFKGTLFATLDLNKLKKLVRSLLEDCQCNYRLLSPRGEIIMMSTPPAAKTGPATQAGFSLLLSPDPAILATQKEIHFLRAIALFIAVNLLLAAIYLLIRHRILRPVSQALAMIAPTAATAGQPPTIMEPHQQLAELANHYRDMQVRLAEQEALITNYRELMEQLQSQQQRFLHASGGEMAAMYQSVCGYAEQLEERILSQQLDPDAAYDLDDVREMSQNLQLLSQCFTAFGNEETLKIEAADPARILQQTLISMEPMLERRNMQLVFNKGRDVWVTQAGAQQWLSALNRALIFTSIRFGEDESVLRVNQQNQGERLEVSCHISRFRQSIIPPEEQDFGMLMPSMAKDMSEAIERKLHEHANILLAESIAARLGGALHVTCEKGKRGFVLIASIATQPLST